MTNLMIRFIKSETIFVQVTVYVAKGNVSSSKTWDMVTLKVADHNKYHIKLSTIKLLFYIKQTVNGKRQRFNLLLNRQKLFTKP